MTEPTRPCPDRWRSGQLLAYVEGDLEEAVRRDLELHLSSCSACSRELQALSKVQALLLAYPVAFHPSEQELFLFAKHGEDPAGSVSEHLQSCPDCAADLEMLREMVSVGAARSEAGVPMPGSLLDRLEDFHPSEIERPRKGWVWFSQVMEWFEGPFRFPVFGLATAVAAVIVIVVAIPMSRILDEIPQPAGLGTKEKVTAPAALPRPAAPRPDDPAEDEMRDRSKSRIQTEKESLEMRPEVARSVPPKDRNGKPEALEYSESSRESSGLQSGEADKSDGVARKKAGGLAGTSRRFRGDPNVGGLYSPAPRYREEGRERARLPRSVAKESKKKLFGARPAKRLPAVQEPAPAARVPTETTDRRTGLVVGHSAKGADSRSDSRVTVNLLITDQNGRDISWLRYSPPQQLMDTYRFLRETGQPADDVSVATTPDHEDRDAALPLKRYGKKAYSISIQVSRSGDKFDLNARLMESRTRRHIRTIQALNVGRNDLPDRVQSLITSMLKAR